MGLGGVGLGSGGGAACAIGAGATTGAGAGATAGLGAGAATGVGAAATAGLGVVAGAMTAAACADAVASGGGAALGDGNGLRFGGNALSCSGFAPGRNFPTLSTVAVTRSGRTGWGEYCAVIASCGLRITVGVTVDGGLACLPSE